jgi:hypothetical protein
LERQILKEKFFDASIEKEMKNEQTPVFFAF